MAKKNQQKKETILTPEQQIEKTNKTISTLSNQKIEQSLKDFSKLSENEREKLFGSKDFFDQFRDFFKKEHPNLLDEIDSQEKLTFYVQNLEEKGFSIENITKNKEFQKEIKETTNEKETITQGLNQLQEYCDKIDNKMPKNIFDNFAKEINLKTTPNIEITNSTKISKIGNLSSSWNKYLEDNNISLKEYQKKDSEKILSPNHLPTERLLISATIKKIKKNLPTALIVDFDMDFPLPIDIHSQFQNLRNLKNQRDLFIDAHRSQIDENLEKKLNNIIITNADIYKEFEFEGDHIEWTKGFSEQTKNFRKMFNKLVTRQVFEEAKEKGSYIENHLEEIGKQFKEFPPYFNELFKIYPYKHKEVIESNPEFKTEYQNQEKILQQKESLLNIPKPEKEKNKTQEQRNQEVYKEVIKAKEELNTIKRKAYAAHIEAKKTGLGNIIEKLIENKFDVNKLSKQEQQKIIDILVQKKLEDSIKNQIPNILGIDPNEYKKFVENLFDLNQQDIIIPTQYGDIPLHFIEKSFLGGPNKESMEIDSSGNLITEFKNLPLNFKVQITEQNKDFFEKNIIFEGLFSTFNSKKGPIKLNDSYKVNIKNKDGKDIEGYLSEYPPSEEIQQEIEANNLEKGRYLYSHPITRPEDSRNIITWDDDGKNPVVIQKKDESDYEIDIISKELNLNDQTIGGLLFSNALGKYNIKKELSSDQEKKLATKFGKIEKNELYRDTNDMTDEKFENKNKTEEIKEENIEEIKQKEYKEFLEERKSLKGYQEKTEGEKSNQGFKNGSKLLIQTIESAFQPSGSYMYMTAEIKNIDEKKGTFQIVYKGNEAQLGPYEGKTETHKLSKESLEKFKERFEDKKIYKLPNEKISNNLNEVIPTLEDLEIDGIKPYQSFKGSHRTGNNFIINIGKEEGKEVTHFGLIETVPGEEQNEESKVGYMYKIEHEPAKKGFKLTINDKEKTELHLDYPNFALFVASRKLQPKTEESSKGIDIPDQEGTKIDQPKKRKGYSISSIIGLVKNFGKKIGDGIKKYEEEQVEELTEAMFYEGRLFNKLAGIMPTDKLKEAFDGAGKEYMQERDNKIWKKIETYQKFYESDPDFGGDYMRGEKIKPFLNGTKKFKNHQQAAAMLLATINKGKGPYSRNTDRAGKGKRIRIMFGEGHQKRYLLMKEKLQRELDQGYKIYGQIWADDLQNEILKLEMKYITHCIDGRQLRIGGSADDTPQLEATFSKKFAGELEKSSNAFFSESISGSSKEKSYSFELARFEYFRLLGDRPQQAIPCLKQIAAKAVTPSQRKVFESAVLTGMLSGVFYNITQEDKSFIQKICRTIGFLPGMWIRDPNHHYKVEQFIKIATGKNPEYEVEKTKDVREKKEYKSDDHGFGKAKDIKPFKTSTPFEHGINKRLLEGGRLKEISDFAAMSGKNYQSKTIIELINDPKTAEKDKHLLKEIEARSLEKDEEVDPDVKMNGYGLEQNIFAKNQSLIDEITDFNDGKFKGKNKDEIQGIQTARRKIAKEVPKEKLNDKNQVIYLVKKFMNRFEGRGFSSEEKKYFIRVLLTVQKEIASGNTKSANDILRYSIVGNIIKNSGNKHPPDELTNGLDAFKDFFKANIDTILQGDVIEKALGNNFVEELSKEPYKVAPWEEYSDLIENQIVFGSKDENKKRSDARKKYNLDVYINDKLYKSARQIEQKNDIPNKFKNNANSNSIKTTTEKIHETLNKKNIRIKNNEITEKIKRKLSNQLGHEDMTDEELLQMQQEQENNYY